MSTPKSKPSFNGEMITEKFIPDHVLIYVAAGALQCYDSTKSYVFNKGDCFIARKNRLAKYKIVAGKEDFKPIVCCLNEAFLKHYRNKHPAYLNGVTTKDSFIEISRTAFLDNFIQSVLPYYTSPYRIDQEFEDVKFEELMIILLKGQPELANFLFDFGPPAKIDLEEFMQKNFTFNVSLRRFAFLTGRSISAFKRDFVTTFNDTPGHWLVQRRLEEAWFLISEKSKRPSEIFFELGFEGLSHFSFAFKKKYGLTPRAMTTLKKPV